MTAWPDPDRSDAHEREHENCGGGYECMKCEEWICIRCFPSPAEPSFCADCDWNMGGTAA